MNYLFHPHPNHNLNQYLKWEEHKEELWTLFFSSVFITIFQLQWQVLFNWVSSGDRTNDWTLMSTVSINRTQYKYMLNKSSTHVMLATARKVKKRVGTLNWLMQYRRLYFYDRQLYFICISIANSHKFNYIVEVDIKIAKMKEKQRDDQYRFRFTIQYSYISLINGDWTEDRF